MGWLRNRGRRYISVLGPLVAVVPAVLCIGWTPAWHDYKPSEVLPDVFVSAGLDALDDGVQRVFAEGDLGGLPSILDLPVPGFPLRKIFASRSALPAGLDWRMFREELAVHEIELRSAPDEMMNIQLAVNAVDGAVVRPFQVFSFNETVGERSSERGFRPGLMFSNGEVVMGLGGGVCIVSTALYDAALKSGYKIIERSHHSGRVRYAEPGLDSAVVYGVLDFCFKNDSVTPVMIRAKIRDDKLIVTFKGKNRPGYEVAFEREGYKEYPFSVVETADPTIPEGTTEVKVEGRPGYEVTTLRVIKQDGKIVRREVLGHDSVGPRDKVILVHADPTDEEHPAEQPAVMETDLKSIAITLDEAPLTAPHPTVTLSETEQPQSPPVTPREPTPTTQPGTTIVLDESTEPESSDEL